MGEIKVRVKLTNNLDEMLQRRGLLGKKKVRTYDTIAVVDTGAVRSAIPPFVLKKLGVMEADRTVASYADGRSEEVPVAEPIGFTIDDRRTEDEPFVLGEEVLIGQTVLEKLDL